jgi:hypothetical protein
MSSTAPPTPIFDGIATLLEFLRDGGADDRYLYRGQLRRYPPHDWTEGGAAHSIEAIYPADFRFHYRHTGPFDDLAARRISSTRAYGRTVRNLFSNFLAMHFSAQPWLAPLVSDFDRHAAANEGVPMDQPFFRTAWSLAQHYLVATALTDVTFDPEVAAWFATVPWDPKAPKPSERDVGVIYRFDKCKLESILTTVSDRMASWASLNHALPPPRLFLEDIRSIPQTFARRPFAQQGASIYGFDQPMVVKLAFDSGAAAAFEFRHGPGQVRLTRSDIVPDDDNFVQHVSRFQAARERLIPRLDLEAPDGAPPEGAPEQPRAPSPLERATATLEIPIWRARRVESLRLTTDCTASIYDNIENSGATSYKYLLVASDVSSDAIICVVAVEESSSMHAPTPKISAQVLASLGLGNQVLGLWNHQGHRAIDAGSWPTLDSFKAAAIPVVLRTLG